MYLKVQYNNSIKNYNLTNEYNKPYIKVSNSILPLTTNTTQGLCIHIQANNTTYRPLEYNSMSTSDTYYTSAINSNGLSSTTALTRSSTYDTQYYTRSSTSSTVYYTRSSTSGTNYLTKTVVNIMNGSISQSNSANGVAQYCNTSYSNINYINGLITSTTTTYPNYIWETTKIVLKFGNNSRTTYRTDSIYQYNLVTSSYSSTNTASYDQISIMLTNKIYENQNVATTWRYTSNNGMVTYGMTYYPTNISPKPYIVNYSCIFDLRTSIVSTTGTQYLTRSSTSATSYLTRSSTYSTVYLTRSSTSGYSGVSSSSSQSSGWL